MVAPQKELTPEELQQRQTTAGQAFDKWSSVYSRFGLQITSSQRESIIQNAVRSKHVSEAVRSQLFSELARASPGRAVGLVLGNVPPDVLTKKQRDEVTAIATRGGNNLANVNAALLKLNEYLPKAGTRAAIREARARKAKERPSDPTQQMLSQKDQQRVTSLDASLRGILSSVNPYLTKRYDRALQEAGSQGQVIPPGARIAYCQKLLGAFRKNIGEFEVVTTGYAGPGRESDYIESHKAIAEIRSDAAKSLGMQGYTPEKHDEIVARAESTIREAEGRVGSLAQGTRDIDQRLVATAGKKKSEV